MIKKSYIIILLVLCSFSVYIPSSTALYQVPSDSYVYDTITSNESYNFSTNVLINIYTNNEVNLYLTCGSDMKLQHASFECMYPTNLELYLNQTDMDYNLFKGKIFRDTNNTRYIYDSGFTAYIINDMEIKFYYYTYEPSVIIHAYLSDESGKIEYEVMNTTFNAEEYYISALIPSGSGIYFVSNIIEDKYGSDELIVGIIISLIVIVGTGIIVKGKSKNEKSCTPPNELVNGKCVNTIMTSFDNPQL